MTRSVVTVDLADRSYEIRVEDGLIGRAGAALAPVLRQRQVVVVTDQTVADLHLAPLLGSLDAAGVAHEAVVVPPGEATKSFSGLESLVTSLLEHGVERRTTVVALGGGVVGDLAGIAAAITLRGLDLVQIPTTLLAQVDSAVGGKTGIDTPHGKNLVGAFHQPRLVLVDPTTLDTLPDRERRAGLAEVVKYGLIDDYPFFEWLERHGGAVLAGEAEPRRRAIVTSLEAKARIVAADEREAGRRALLNLGHTFAHAFEAELGYDGRVLHGEAVALGLVLAFHLSARLDLCPPEAGARVARAVASWGLPASPAALGPERWDLDRLIGHMRRDKKVRDGRITFVLARGIGEAFVADDVPPEAVTALLDEALAA